MKIRPWHKISEEDLKVCLGPRGGIDEFELARLFERKSCIGHAKVFPKLNLYYVYDRDQGIYVEMYPPEMKSFIANLAHDISPKVARIRTVMSICNEIFYGPLSEPGEPVFDRDKIVFLNGTLDLHTKKFGSWSPEYFIVHKVDYKYDPEAKCPTIDNFLHGFCEGHKDRYRFLLSWLYILVYGHFEGQVLLYIWGSGGSGKSTLAHIITALIGRPAAVTTTLKALHKDPFEITNLRGKKLILISDTEYYKGDLSVLKMISGGDSVTGRIKFIQGAHEVNVEGQVLIVGNYPLGSRDTSGSMIRRLRMFPANRKVENRRFDLISYKGNKYSGVFVEELPGLMNAVLQLGGEEALRVVSDPSLTPSLEMVQRETEERSNPILRWVREELTRGPGAYLGYKTIGGGSKEALDEISRRKVLYPTFERWANRNGLNSLSHVMFTQALLVSLRAEGYTCEKIKREKGIYITGVTIPTEVYDQDYIYGAPPLGVSDLEGVQICPGAPGVTISDVNPGVPDQPGTMVVGCPHSCIGGSEPEKSQTHEYNNKFGASCFPIPEDELKNLLSDYTYPEESKYLYGHYLKSLGKSPMKDDLLSYSKVLDINIEDLCNQFLHSCTYKDTEYKDKILHMFSLSKRKLAKGGAFPYAYKPLGISPRIIPTLYGPSLNCSKKVFREAVFKGLGAHALEEYKLRLVDVDLVSCYVSILLGLYPEELSPVREAIEGKGLWSFIMEEFRASNNEKSYNKPAVKVCVYASLFQGGNTAMISGIMDNIRKDLGLTNQEFKASAEYEPNNIVAHAVTSQMQKSKIICAFRELAHKVGKKYHGSLLKGPTGHEYPVNESSFRKSYPSFLQSYEFTILAAATIRTLASIPGAEVISHFHDGNVFIVPDAQCLQFKETLDTAVLTVGSELGLVYPQKVECKYYPPSVV